MIQSAGTQQIADTDQIADTEQGAETHQSAETHHGAETYQAVETPQVDQDQQVAQTQQVGQTQTGETGDPAPAQQSDPSPTDVAAPGQWNLSRPATVDDVADPPTYRYSDRPPREVFEHGLPPEDSAGRGTGWGRWRARGRGTPEGRRYRYTIRAQDDIASALTGGIPVASPAGRISPENISHVYDFSAGVVQENGNFIPTAVHARAPLPSIAGTPIGADITVAGVVAYEFGHQVPLGPGPELIILPSGGRQGVPTGPIHFGPNARFRVVDIGAGDDGRPRIMLRELADPAPVHAPVRTVEVDSGRWQPAKEPFVITVDGGRPRVERRSGPSGVRTDARYHLSMTEHEWTFTIRVHLTAADGVSPADLEAVRSGVRRAVEVYLNAPEHALPATGATLKVAVDFVDRPDQAHRRITVVPGNLSQGNMTQDVWTTQAPLSARAHEVVHGMGVVHDIRGQTPHLTSSRPADDHDLMGVHDPGVGYELTGDALSQIVDVASPYVGSGVLPAPPPKPDHRSWTPVRQSDLPTTWAGYTVDATPFGIRLSHDNALKPEATPVDNHRLRIVIETTRPIDGLDAAHDLLDSLPDGQGRRAIVDLRIPDQITPDQAQYLANRGDRPDRTLAVRTAGLAAQPEPSAHVLPSSGTGLPTRPGTGTEYTFRPQSAPIDARDSFTAAYLVEPDPGRRHDLLRDHVSEDGSEPTDLVDLARLVHSVADAPADHADAAVIYAAGLVLDGRVDEALVTVLDVRGDLPDPARVDWVLQLTRLSTTSRPDDRLAWRALTEAIVGCD